MPDRSRPASHGTFASISGRRSMIVRIIILGALAVSIGAALLLGSTLEGTLRAFLSVLG